MSNLNKFCLQGRLGADPLVTTPGAKKKVIISIAVEQINGKTSWIRISSWEKTAEFVEKYFHKGDSIILDGYISTFKPKESAYEVMELVAEHIYFPGSKAEKKTDPAEDPSEYEITEIGDLPF